MLEPIKTKRTSQNEIAQSFSAPAPIGGLNTKDALATMSSRFATEMTNFWPTYGSVVLRKGATLFATNLAKPTKTLLAYRSPTLSKLFVATDDGLFDVTAGGGSAFPVASPLTSGWCRYVNYNTAAGSFLHVVNGVDSLRYYDGISWAIVASMPILPSGTLTTSDITNIETFKQSLFFIRKDSLTFYYLPVASVTGSVKEFPLGTYFRKGGKLIAMGTWTVDGGVGADDYAVFVTSAGQIAVYKGTDPSVAGNWSLVGVYDVANPVGPRCLCKVGGDLFYISESGLMPLSKVLQSARLDVTTVVTDLIQPTFQAAATAYSTVSGWQVIVNPALNLLLVNAPSLVTSDTKQFAMNVLTGAWTTFSGWPATSWELLGSTLYFSYGNGVAKAWQNSSDFGVPITGTARQAWIYFPSRARLKQVRAVRPNLLVSGKLAVNFALDTDFQPRYDYGPVINNEGANARFGTGVFNGAQWTNSPTMQLNWLTVANSSAYCAAPRLRVIGGDVTFEWSATDFAYETGGILG